MVRARFAKRIRPLKHQPMSAFEVESRHPTDLSVCPLMPRSGHPPKLGYASGTFDVRYHETLDFLRITGALRCKANNFFGYDFN